jgi:Type II secretion system (T2SS), protein M subtype b
VIDDLPNLIRRIVFLALNGLALAAVYAVLIGPLLNWHAENSTRIDELERLNGRLRALAEQAPRIQQQVADNSQLPRAEEKWRGESPSAVGASVQARLRELADRTNVRLRSLGVSAQSGALTAMSIRTDASAPIGSLYAFLTAIETETPFLFVTGAIIRQPASPGISQAQEEAELEFQLDVSAPLKDQR